MSSNELTMLLVGDVHVQRDEPHSAFAACRDQLRGADITYANLECAIVDVERLSHGLPEGPKPRSDERVLEAYADAGFDVFSLANNASMYMGLEGLLRTIDLLDGKGIAHCGGGRNLAEAQKPVIVERNGVRVAFVSVTSVYAHGGEATKDRGGVAVVRVHTAYQPPPINYVMPGWPPVVRTYAEPADAAAMQRIVRSAKADADIVVVSWHWGIYSMTGDMPELCDYQVEMAHAAIDAGADLVVGHHAHALQAIEVYKGKPIFHSLGDFVHDELYALVGARREATMAVRCTVRDGKIDRIAILPGHISEVGLPEPMLSHPDEVRWVVEDLEKASKRFGIRLEVDQGELVLRT